MKLIKHETPVLTIINNTVEYQYKEKVWFTLTDSLEGKLFWKLNYNVVHIVDTVISHLRTHYEHYKT